MKRGNIDEGQRYILLFVGSWIDFIRLEQDMQIGSYNLRKRDSR